LLEALGDTPDAVRMKIKRSIARMAQAEA